MGVYVYLCFFLVLIVSAHTTIISNTFEKRVIHYFVFRSFRMLSTINVH